MSELYPFCFKCDGDLSEEEKNFNKSYDNKFYPICGVCLKKAEKKLNDILKSQEK